MAARGAPGYLENLPEPEAPMRRLALTLLPMLALARSASAAEPPAPQGPTGPAKGASAPAPNMETYQLVLLWRGPRSSGEVTPETQEIQRRHIAHLQAMGKAGKLVVAGPFSDQPDAALRGACLYRVGSVAEARALAEEDPAVQAGRLRVEVLTWWVEKGTMEFPRSPPRVP
jgi:uncharacterized protein